MAVVVGAVMVMADSFRSRTHHKVLQQKCRNDSKRHTRCTMVSSQGLHKYGYLATAVGKMKMKVHRVPKKIFAACCHRYVLSFAR